MPRFVILEHDAPKLHWDLMLESGHELSTWRLTQPPLKPGSTMDARALPDHRRIYLEYEGPVSGNRGTVKRWDAGVYREAEDSTTESRHCFLEGDRVTGWMRLDRRADGSWTFCWLAQ